MYYIIIKYYVWNSNCITEVLTISNLVVVQLQATQCYLDKYSYANNNRLILVQMSRKHTCLGK